MACGGPAILEGSPPSASVASVSQASHTAQLGQSHAQIRALITLPVFLNLE